MGRLIEFRNQTLVVGVVVLLIVLALLLLQVVVHVGCQNDHLCIVFQRVVGRRTPYHVDVRVQLVEELRDFRQFRHEERRLVAGVDVEQDAFRLADVVAVEQGRVQRVDDGTLHAPLAAGPANGHDGTAAVAHRCLHIAEVKVDAALRADGDEFRDALHGVLQDVVGPLQCLLQCHLRVVVDVADALVVHNQHRVDVLPQLVDTLERLHDLAFLLEVERNCHHADGQYAAVLRHLRHHRSRTRARAAAHASRHKHHLRAVVQQPLYVLDVALSLLTPHVGVGTGAQAHRAQLQFHRHGRLRQRSAIGVAHRERHALDALTIHVADGILSAAAHADHLNNIL